MLVFSQQSLAFIAVPKTGTTAVETGLRSYADILFAKQFKHMTARRFRAKIAPFLRQAYGLRPDLFAVMREPEEQIRSWYRYRARDENLSNSESTGTRSFDEFVLAVISDAPPPFARIGSQLGMLTTQSDEMLVHHLFAYEKQPLFRSFVSERFGGKIAFKPMNVSPQTHAPLDPAIRRKLHAARPRDFDLYARLRDAGGHLQSPIATPA